mmetsp:Transcript_30586/g.64706  ORF Transcript_30586/g.64706 Transcript_30586/m.64706 type:complete len:1199 (+) Transcript_30586:90-3686(+)
MAWKPRKSSWKYPSHSSKYSSSSVSCYDCGGSHYRGSSNCPRYRKTSSTSSSKSSSSSSSKTKATKATKHYICWADYKLTQLQDKCREWGLKVSGRKAAVIERLEKYVLEGGGSTAGGEGAPASSKKQKTGLTTSSQPMKAPAAAAVKDEVFDLFEVDDSKPPAIMGDSKPPSLMPLLSQSSHTMSSSQTTTSSSSSSVVNVISTIKKKPEITEEQKARTRQKLEEARRKKLARSSASFAGSAGSATGMNNNNAVATMSHRSLELGGNHLSRSPLSQQGNKRKSCAISMPIVNPYLQKLPTMKRDESKPDDSILFGGGLEDTPEITTMDDLPPLPRDAPKVRENTLEILSEEQLVVVMAARPPSVEVAVEEVEESGDGSAKDLSGDHDNVNVKKKLFPTPVNTKSPKTHPMLRVNAAAGTGKTTALIHLAARCIDLGHTSLTYVTFSRASAKDAETRMKIVMLNNDNQKEEHKLHLDMACVKEVKSVDKVNASTLHSCAMRLLQNEPNMNDAEIDKQKAGLLNDLAFQDLLKRQWGKDLDVYLERAVKNVTSLTKEEEAHKLSGKVNQLYDKALFYLTKTFSYFLKSDTTLEQLSDEKNSYKRHWFPISKKGCDAEFKSEGAAAKLGFPPAIYSLESSYSFFANTCVEIWQYVVKHNIRTFDIEIKKAQLIKLKIPCSVLLVDECQDLNGCHVDWIEKQRNFGTHIFFVGDSAQCIFGYNGAKSSNVMKLTHCIDTNLTRSWRFGPNIAKFANIALFAKEKSAQTTNNFGNKRLWIPYRVVGARKDDGKEEKDDEDGDVRGGLVTTKSLLEDWKKYRPLTVIGRDNGGLMIKAMDLLGLGALKNPTPEETADGDGEEGMMPHFFEMMRTAALGRGTIPCLGMPPIVVDDAMVTMIDTENLPKLHINGKGETSGAGKWKQSLREIRHLYELYTNKDENGQHLPMTLPAKEFRDFANEDSVTWGSFIETCNIKDITKYNMALRIIQTYQQNTLKAINAFESHATANKCPAEEADIILTTGHSAKGLEWDHVEICDDFLDLSAASFTESQKLSLRHPSFLKAMPGQSAKSETPTSPLEISKGDRRKGWQFILSEYLDGDINLLYVAMTRAKKTLSVPTSIKMLLQDFDRLHYLVETFKKDATGADRKMPLSNDESMMVVGKKKLNKGDVWNLYHDLCVPLRKEMEIADDCTFMQSLLPDCD